MDKDKDPLVLSVKVSREDYPELFAELNAVSPRKRAGRFRNLAYVGLIFLASSRMEQEVSPRRRSENAGSRRKLKRLAEFKNSMEQ